VCLRCRSVVSLLSKQVKCAKSKDAASGSSSATNMSKARDKTGHSDKTSGKPVDAQKFQLYFDFKAYISSINPHQVAVSVLCNLQAYFLISHNIVCLYCGCQKLC